MTNKSWGLTLVVYIFSIAVAAGITFTDIELDDSQILFIGQVITTLVGSTTAGGAFVSAMKHRGSIATIVKEIKKIAAKDPNLNTEIKKKLSEI